MTIDDKKKKLKEQLRFAALIMRKLPEVKVRAYCQFWPQILHSQEEKMCWKSENYHFPLKQEEIDTMEKILDYYRPLDAFETKLVWQRAEGKPWKILSSDFGYSRAYLAQKYDVAIAKMLIFIGFSK